MQKSIKIVSIILVIVLFVNLTISYAINNSNSTDFFTVSKSKISVGETLKMIIDLSKIDYDEFTFTLNPSVNVNDISIKESVVASKDESLNTISIEVDKSTINVSSITLYYDVPETITSEDKMELTAQILVANNVIDTNSTSTDKVVAKESNKEVSIIEENQQENAKNNNNQMDENSMNDKQANDREMNNKDNEQRDSKGELQNENSKVSESSSKVGNISVQGDSEETATYNGSSNNYLSNLEIEGLELNTTFNKEKQTYFVEAKDISSVNITATTEDDNAKVYITGADLLKTGTNKILVSVTAENGNSRSYRVFVEVK